MKGFIDLTFRHGDTYYILDYKSNHLGSEGSDYDSPKLAEAVTDAGYDLQYHIYTLALHRFLRNRIEGYEYDQHFGGVFYLFLRGVELNQPGSGVFFDRPDKKLIDKMDRYFSTGRVE
jgi:exodeoxyribonuclease V beta subunit